MMKLLNRERGFTIIEALVAQVILITVALAVWSVFIAGSRYNAESEDRTVAANIAQLKMEEIMNTRFRYIVVEHPIGETRFDSLPQNEPYWVLDTTGSWMTSLPEGKYTISYPGPDDEDSDPLEINVRVSWKGVVGKVESFVDMETLVSMTPGRFR